MRNKNSMSDIPNKFDVFSTVLCYEYEIHKWIYDIKYYRNGNNWCLDPEGKMILREVTERELKAMEQLQNVVDEREKENAAWLAHKQCRKRSCVCKKCEKYCHCYDCVDKITSCEFVST